MAGVSSPMAGVSSPPPPIAGFSSPPFCVELERWSAPRNLGPLQARVLFGNSSRLCGGGQCHDLLHTAVLVAVPDVIGLVAMGDTVSLDGGKVWQPAGAAVWLGKFDNQSMAKFDNESTFDGSQTNSTWQRFHIGVDLLTDRDELVEPGGHDVCLRAWAQHAGEQATLNPQPLHPLTNRAWQVSVDMSQGFRGQAPGGRVIPTGDGEARCWTPVEYTFQPDS